MGHLDQARGCHAMLNYILLPVTFCGYTICVVYIIQVVIVQAVELEPVRNPKSLVSKGLRVGFC